MSFPFGTELVAENTIFGTQQAVWKERLCDKSALEENIRTVAFTASGSQRLLCVMQTPLFLCLFGLNVLLHHLGPQKHVSHSMPISTHYFTVHILIFLYLYLDRRKHRMRPTSK
jgi:hypothetical protein